MKAPQPDLFGDVHDQGPPVGLAPVSDEDRAVAAALPARVRLGTSSWNFTGWAGVVWDRVISERTAAREGLSAYSQHPLFRTVGVDRSHYAVVDAESWRRYASQTPDDFRFLVKALDEIMTPTFHKRHGPRDGEVNPRFLDAGYAVDVTAPILEGLDDKLGVLLFQAPPFDVAALGGAAVVVDRLHQFFRALPRDRRFRLALEVRNPVLIGRPLQQALMDVDVDPCLSSRHGMPPVHAQAKALLSPAPQALVIRWLLRHGLTYADGEQRYAPYDRIVDDDGDTRFAISGLVRSLDVPTFVIANNKAEGCAPETLLRLARQIIDGQSARGAREDRVR